MGRFSITAYKVPARLQTWHPYFERYCDYAESLSKASAKGSKCLWLGEKLNRTNVFFSTMNTVLSIILFMKLSIAKTSTSVLANAEVLSLCAIT